MLIEIILRGGFSTLNFDFFKILLSNAGEVYFNYPETENVKSSKEVLNIIKSNDYVDLVINTDHLDLDGKIIPRVFINFGRDNNEIDILFYLHLNDLKEPTQKNSIDYLWNWVKIFQIKYNFQYFICQMDNSDKNDFFFDSNGIGNMYLKMGKR